MILPVQIALESLERDDAVFGGAPGVVVLISSLSGNSEHGSSALPVALVLKLM
jgi:hypothetical protein